MLRCDALRTPLTVKFRRQPLACPRAAARPSFQSSPWAGATTPGEPFPLGTSSPRSGRLWKSYASQVTTGVTSKFSVSGGDCVFHSSPVAGHGFSPATFPKNAAQVKYTIGSRYPTAKIDAPAVDITL